VKGNDSRTLTANEWNDLLDKINEFREYKGLVTRFFNRGITSGAINGFIELTADSFNAAINVTNEMSPQISVPPFAGINQIIYTTTH
jgi:hypothetical protein